eukprot:3190946-Pyramimonas_sp.AAC.1
MMRRLGTRYSASWWAGTFAEEAAVEVADVLSSEVADVTPGHSALLHNLLQRLLRLKGGQACHR